MFCFLKAFVIKVVNNVHVLKGQCLFVYLFRIFTFGTGDLIHQSSREVNTNMECEKDINTCISISDYSNYSRQSFHSI